MKTSLKKWIAWDTSSLSGLVVAATGSAEKGVSVLSEFRLSSRNSAQSEKLIWAIDQCLFAADWTLAEIDYIGVGIGPGSFTGLRLAVTTAKTLAFANDLPIVTFSSLALQARNCSTWYKPSRKKSLDPLILYAVDACKGEIYSIIGSASRLADCVDSQFKCAWTTSVEETVLTHEAFRKKVKQKMRMLKSRPWIAFGEAFERYPELLADCDQTTRQQIDSSCLSSSAGSTLAQLCHEGIELGIARSNQYIFPRYFRESDAEIKLKNGLIPSFISRFELDQRMRKGSA